MKFSKKSFFGILMMFVFTLAFTVNSTLSAKDFYQLKVYTIKDKAQEASVDKYLEDAFLPAMHRAGVEKVGVFKPIADDKAAGTKIFVFIPIKKLDDIIKLEGKLAKDNAYQTAGSDYINASYDNPPYERIQSILIKAFKQLPAFYTPSYSTKKSEQIYELRSYEGATEKIWKKKVEMFDEAGEVELFKKLEFNAVFYGEVVSGAAMPNLMYMTTFKDMKSHDEHWDAFRIHPDWKKLSGMQEYKNTVSHIDKWLMHPAEYSDI
jgi:hypothetical protein